MSGQQQARLVPAIARENYFTLLVPDGNLRHTMTPDQIQTALKAVTYPGYSRDIVSFGMVKDISCAEDMVSVVLQLPSTKPETAQQVQAAAERVLNALPGMPRFTVEVRHPVAATEVPSRALDSQNKIVGIKRVLAVASGKGGVGKSTCSANLACALQFLGAKVGLLDCDIYGPSIPLMMGVTQQPTISTASRLVPPIAHGVKVMSIGLLMENDRPVIWRGPMIAKTIQQFLMAFEWGELDFLLVDLPPGTGDAQLSLCQTVALDGGVIISTPQEASLGVVRKGIEMFKTVNVPILGIVENMSYLITPSGDRMEIFGHGGGQTEAERQKIPFLGEIPFFMEIREGGDRGTPIVVAAPNHPGSQSFIQIAAKLQKQFS